MTGQAPAAQQLDAHAFLPLDGPDAGCAWAEFTAFWARCRAELDLTSAALDGVPVAPPGTPPRRRWDHPVAAARDGAGRYRSVARRERNLLTFSLRFAAGESSAGRVRIGAADRWADYARWWAGLATGALSTAIGTCLVFQARRARPGTDPGSWAAALPAAESDAPDWWRHPRELGPGTVAWDVTAGRNRPDRRMVVLTGPGAGTELSVRSLANAARMRHEARTHGLSASLVRVAKESTGKVRGWRLAEARWQLVDRTLQIALAAVAASDGNTLGTAVSELELLGPVRPGRVGGSPELPCPEQIHTRVRRLSLALDAGDR